MSNGRDPRQLTYIREAIALIEARAKAGKTAFMDNVDVQDAVLWRLQTLAEATGKLSPELKGRHPLINWRAIYGFRNVAPHAYLDLKLDIVWEVIEVHLPSLKSAVIAEIGEGPTRAT